MDSDRNRIVCPSCGKRYAWKPQLAGKRVKCACGEAFTVPAEAPGDAAVEADDLYAFNDEPAAVASAPRAAVAPATPTAVPPPLPQLPAAAPKAPEVLTYESKRVVEQKRKAMFEHWRLTDLWLPLSLVVLGIACRQLVPYMGTAIGGARLTVTIALVALGLAFNIVLMIAAMKVAAMLADVEFGHPAQATVKLGFMFVVSAAAGAFFASIDKFDTLGITVGVHAMIVLYWILFPLLFKTGVQETMWAVSIIIIIQAIVNIGVWKV
jgi:hypothetical protein